MPLRLHPLTRHPEIRLMGLLLLVIQLLLSCQPSPPEDSAEYRAFDQAIGSGDFAEALAQGEAIRDKFPELPTGWLLIGRVHSELGDHEKSITSFRRATEIDPELAGAHYPLAVALIQQGKMKEAITSLQRTTELDPSYVAAFANLGVAYTRTGDLDKAIASCRRAIELEPDFAAAHAVLGAALSMQGNTEKGIDSLRRAIELDPNYPSAHSNLGNALLQAGETEEAITSLRRGIELDPANPYPYPHLARAYHLQGQPDQSGIWLARLGLIQGQLNEASLTQQILLKFRDMKLDLPATKPPSDETIQAYYQTHPHQFSDAPIHLRMISVDKAAAPLEFMETLRRRLANGSDFALAAKAYSSDSSAAEGGDRGWVKHGDLREDLEKAAFALEAGQFSDVIEDDTHYRLLNVTERKDGTLPPLIEVREKIITILEDEAQTSLIKGWIQQAG